MSIGYRRVVRALRKQAEADAAPKRQKGERKALSYVVRIDRKTTQMFPHQHKAPDIPNDWTCSCCKTITVSQVLPPARARGKK